MRRSPARSATCAAALAAALVLSAGPAAARDDDPTASRGLGIELLTKEQERAISRGLAWIAAHQQPGGSWGEKDETRVADTALSVLALMAGGNTVGAGRRLDPLRDDGDTEGPPQLRGPYAAQVRDGLDYLARLAWSRREGKIQGYIQDDQVSRMHGHGFATLALATASGNLGGHDLLAIRTWLSDDASRDASQLPFADQVRYGLSRAVRVTEHAQDPDSGGWLYDPFPDGHEGSMTVTQIHALRAAQDAGLAVSGVVMRKAYDYVRDSQNLADRDLYGGFAYHKTLKTRVRYPLTAAALTTFFGLGRYGSNEKDKQLIEDGMKFLDRRFDDALHARQWFYYGLFYGAQAIYQEQSPRRLREQWPRIRSRVLREQKADGSFRPVGDDGRSVEYATAMGTLILQVPTETLPIFQRR